MRLLFLLPMVMLGCSSDSVKLDPEWAPLEEVRENPVLAAGLGDAGARTVGEVAYVKDVDKFMSLDRSVLRSILRHEQEHSKRQHEMGVYEWLAKYGTSREFRVDEEKIGWYYQIRSLLSQGQRVDPVAVGKAMSYVWDQEKATAWAQEVIAGRWSP